MPTLKEKKDTYGRALDFIKTGERLIADNRALLTENTILRARVKYLEEECERLRHAYRTANEALDIASSDRS